MPLEKGPHFATRDIFIDYPYGTVMFRWDHMRALIYRKFYGEPEGATPVSHDNNLFNQALLYGDEITPELYSTKEA